MRARGLFRVHRGGAARLYYAMFRRAQVDINVSNRAAWLAYCHDSGLPPRSLQTSIAISRSLPSEIGPERA